MSASKDSVPWDVMAEAYLLARRETAAFVSWADVAATWPTDRLGGERNANAVKKLYSRLTGAEEGSQHATRLQKAREVFVLNPVPHWFKQGNSAEEWFVWAIDNNMSRLVRPF